MWSRSPASWPYASAALDPAYMGIGLVPASRCLERAGWQVDDLDLVEANEAFAAQSLGVNREMGWDAERVNVNGGAIALGHPIGASGTRIIVTPLHEMLKHDANRGLATLWYRRRAGSRGGPRTIEPRIDEREDRGQPNLTARLMEQKPMSVLTEMGKRRWNSPPR